MIYKTHKLRISKKGLVFLFLMLAVFFVSSSSQAMFPQNQGQCDPTFVNLQRELAHIGLLRDTAVAEEILQQPASASLMSCADQALGVSGHLGNIFSDNQTSLIGGLGSILSSYAGGAPATLSSHLMNVMGSVLQSWNSGNFSNAVGAALTSLLVNSITSLATSVLGSTLGGLLLAVANFACSGYQDMWNVAIKSVGINVGGTSVTIDNVMNGNFAGGGGAAPGGAMTTLFGNPTSVNSRNNTRTALENMRVGSSPLMNTPLSRQNLCGSPTCKPTLQQIRNCISAVGPC